MALFVIQTAQLAPISHSSPSVLATHSFFHLESVLSSLVLQATSGMLILVNANHAMTLALIAKALLHRNV